MQSDIKTYIASPFFNGVQLRVVEQIERMLKENNIRYYSPRSEGVLQNMTPDDKAIHMGEIFKKNVEEMEWATHMIAVIDNYDIGTVWEMGYFFKSGKEIITYSDNYYGINVMLNESIKGHCINMEDIIPTLLGDFKTHKGSDVI